MKKTKKDWTPHKYLVAAARKTWRWSPARTQVLNRAKVDKGLWRCEQCQTVVGSIQYITKRGRKAKKIDGAIDHIQPIGTQPRDWSEYPTFYALVFCGIENLQFLCSSCHDTKSKKEAGVRKLARKAAKDARMA